MVSTCCLDEGCLPASYSIQPIKTSGVLTRHVVNFYPLRFLGPSVDENLQRVSSAGYPLPRVTEVDSTSFWGGTVLCRQFYLWLEWWVGLTSFGFCSVWRVWKSTHFICPPHASPHDLRSQRVRDHLDEHVWDHSDVDYNIPGCHVLAQINDQTDA